jgi:hypothetical protein
MSDVNLAPDAKPDAPVSEGPQAVADISSKVTDRFKRSNIRPGSSHYDAPPVELSDPAEVEKLAPGTKFKDPTGKVRVKPYTVRAETADQDLEAVPEGAQFVDPTGKMREKPKFEPLNFSSQTLYDMSVTPSEKRKSLERSYPGNVKEDKEGLYVEDNGKFRRPGRGLSSAGGFVASAAAPTAGSVLGALGLGAVSGPVGGVVGGATGAAGGQLINDAVLQLAGVYDRSTSEELANVGMAGAMGSAGAGVGRGIAAVVPATKAGISSVGQMLPTLTAKFLGAGPELTAARELSEKGVKVPPSAWAHESPHLQNLVEVFDPAFRTNKPLLESATAHYEASANKVLDDLGVKPEGSIVKPETAVPTQAAGEKILQKTLAESAAADRALADAMAQRKAALESGIPEQVAQRESITKAAEQSRQAAQKLIDAGFQSIQAEADAGFKWAGSGANTGDLWESIGNKLIAVRRGIGERASKMYGEADQLAGGRRPDITNVSDAAKEFRDKLPGDFKNKYPDIVKKLDDLAGKIGENGEIVKETVDPTFGQLHELRSLLRGNADWWTLSSDIRNGTYKYFSKAVDEALHNPNAGPELQAAAKQLDIADKFYRDNIPIFDAQQLKAVMRGLEAGEPADPANLYKVLVKEGQTDLTKRVKEMVGPNLWAGVRAADTDAMLSASKTLNPGEINGRSFAKEVLDRHQRGMLETVHGKEASEQLLAQARAIEQLEGRLSIPAKPGDTITQVIARARMAAEEAKAVGTKDPLTALAKDVKRLEAETKREASTQRRNDPLGFLYNKSTGASYAVDKILGDEDLILASAARFGDKSPEFNALRQVYVERLLRSTTNPGSKLEKIALEVQNLMFPGVTGDQMKMLAKEMALLSQDGGLGKTTAGSMSAMSKVENPLTQIPGAKGVVKMIPGANPAARATLGKYYAMVTKLMTSPTTLRWLEKGLTKGTPEEQEAMRNILRAHLQKGAAMGAGAGEAAYQGSGE